MLSMELKTSICRGHIFEAISTTQLLPSTFLGKLGKLRVTALSGIFQPQAMSSFLALPSQHRLPPTTTYLHTYTSVQCHTFPIEVATSNCSLVCSECNPSRSRKMHSKPRGDCVLMGFVQRRFGPCSTVRNFSSSLSPSAAAAV